MQDPYLHIEDYINGTLSATDRQDFELALATDEKLRQAVADLGLVDLIAEAALEEELTTIVQQEIDKQKPDTKKGVNPWAWVIAAAVVIGLFYLNGYMVKKTTNSTTTFAEVYVETAWESGRGTKTNETNLALSLWQQGDKKAALSVLKATGETEANYWLAEVFLYEQQFDSSLFYVQLVPVESKFKAHRKVYVRILSLYFAGQKEQAIREIRSLPDTYDKNYMELLTTLISEDS